MSPAASNHKGASTRNNHVSAGIELGGTRKYDSKFSFNSGIKPPQSGPYRLQEKSGLKAPAASHNQANLNKKHIIDVPKLGQKSLFNKHFKNQKVADENKNPNKECVLLLSGKVPHRMEVAKQSSTTISTAPCSFCDKEIRHYERNKLLKCGHRSH